jgi:hypothetical protein
MTAPGTRAGRLSGAIAVAAIAVVSAGPAFMPHPQAHAAAAQTMITATVAVNCPPPAAPVASQDGQPSC